jgi:hypothetical protein
MVDDVPEDRPGYGVELHALGFVDRVEERGKRVAEAETAAAAVADVEYALQLRRHCGIVVKCVVPPVERVPRGSLQAALASIFWFGHGRWRCDAAGSFRYRGSAPVLLRIGQSSRLSSAF